jgi:hypothetical protein
MRKLLLLLLCASCASRGLGDQSDVIVLNPDMAVAGGGSGGGGPDLAWSNLPTCGASPPSFTGAWSGTVTTPWTQPYKVWWLFNPDGTYQAESPPGTLPLYYDANPELGTWHIVDIHSDGSASGHLTLSWLPNNAERWESIFVTTGHLSFDYYHFDTYGPVHYELDCSP